MVRIYVEGGGRGQDLRTRCREGFRKLIQSAGFENKTFKIIACGSRNKAFSYFCNALKSTTGADFIILLVDSEDQVSDTTKPWAHLRARDDWEKPKAAKNENAHLMVQVMESWFYADKEGLAEFYGDGFHVKSLSSNIDIEVIPKDDILAGLEKATKNTTKREYDKGEISFKILACLDPAKIRQQLPSAKRFFDTLQTVTAQK
ncbi:MAG: DUF4276 family protein [bacterium]|nr:DUF4276 family protein [bacterium]